MSIRLDEHQMLAIDNLKNGSILNGGVGSGKSRTALAYYYLKECKGTLKINGKGKIGLMTKPKNLYIITTARKRDTLEWEGECAPFLLSTKKNISISGVEVVIDSWNNIKKYIDVKDSFFIFDEQRLVGAGAWVKSFLKIIKSNRWILLSATPGDTWMDYVPVFIANGFYKNRTEFIREHVIYSRWVKFPKIDKYVNTGKLIRYRKSILVNMKYKKNTVPHFEEIVCEYAKDDYETLSKKRWNIFKNQPIRNMSELCYNLRQVVNSHPSRIQAVEKLTKRFPKLIIFYNFNYELYILRDIGKRLQIPTAEWNGHKHESIPKTDSWLYLVQYTSNAEGWNCIETNAMIFYSPNYSYRITTQSAGRIDRRNTPFRDLYYYTLRTESSIDQAIMKALKNKRNFNEKDFSG